MVQDNLNKLNTCLTKRNANLESRMYEWSHYPIPPAYTLDAVYYNYR